MAGGRWPDGRQAAVSITMDNMGEAAELGRRDWPKNQPVGEHPSVLDALPPIADLLQRTEVRATYFIEGWNTLIYPNDILSMHQRGHEVAFHGWQHESWAQLEPSNERELFERGVAAFEARNLTMHGFRPPGGVLTESSPSLLKEFGFTYCSPAGKHPAIDDETVYLPFDWQGVDAYYYSDSFAGLREAKGDATSPLAPDAFISRAFEIIENRIDTGGYTALLFHPFLEMSDDRLNAMRTILERVMSDDRIWCAPGHEIASWIRDHRSEFGADPGFDTTTWSR